MCPAPETNKRVPQPAQVDLNAWRPSAAQPVLRARAQMLAGIRAFFAAREVLEVETPMLSQAATTDPALASMRVAGLGYWLHTSPELPMKRLLASGLGPIYQICRVFRDGERGRLHHPEFTLLEWYRPGWTLSALMQEVADLVHDLLHRLELPPKPPLELPVEFIRYRELFQCGLDIDPWHCSPRELQAVAQARGLGAGLKLDTDAWLDFLLTHCLEPQLGQHGLSFVQDYPPSQAALARLSEDDPPHAQRFELYWQGIELANGFQELTDAAQQRQRFAEDQAVRAASGLAPVAQDEQFLAALEAGLPESAGVALGLDRLLMLACGAERIDQVLAFPIERA
ncbi:EF-P lysine aminoacylase EpmA [Rhabdochromatium marinum]|uniref:EF-P lysine aminoacylase EpmA n=1 Tax=Rhabdochromatium marinum TaxID=48729 RepID=UPI0019032E93|nr:EF-P lysine aminoacylase EpmA [Rhabdochromatium marinum]MBK1647081.1 EF-P lysine aminoacylase GenX [Rhabdochromatium marinum]